MGRLTGTKTLGNLVKAFVGESQARMRYVYFAKAAKKGGYSEISDIFNETAENETQHAKMFYRYISEEQAADGVPAELHVPEDAAYPFCLSDDTYVNLVNAANGEEEEWGTLYPSFSDDAKAEGFMDIAATFAAIVEAEKAHEARYRKLAQDVKNKTVFARPEAVLWRCGVCGYTLLAKEAPQKCPFCGNPQADFAVAEFAN